MSDRLSNKNQIAQKHKPSILC